MRFLILVLWCQQLHHMTAEATCFEEGDYSQTHITWFALKNVSNFIIHGLKSCSAASIVLIYEDNPWIDVVLEDLSETFSKEIIYYNIDDFRRDDIKKNLYTFYADLHLSFYIIIGERAPEIMDIAEEIFQEHKRGKAAIMPHKSKWLLWVNDSDQENRLVQQQHRSQMDNVAFIRLCRDQLNTLNTVTGSQLNFTVYTFMWNRNRSRNTTLIDMDSTDDRLCVIFPNSRHGMNGRQLDVYGVMYLSPNYLDIVTDPEIGKFNYVGFRIELLRKISQSLNFTFTMSIQDSVPIHLHTLKNREADIGLSMWPTNTPFDEIDITFPVHYDTLRGVYLRPCYTLSIYNSNNMPVFLLAPFPPSVYIIIVIVVFSTSVMWMIVEFFSPDDKEKNQHTCSKNMCHEVNKKAYAKQKFFEFLAIMWTLSSSILHQGHISNNDRMSSRILTWSWCLCMVLFYAAFTGHLTSHMVQQTKDVPFNTFSGLLADGEYEWGTVRDDLKVKGILTNYSNPVLNQLGELLHILEDQGGMEESRQNVIKRLEDRFVLIYYESFISTIVNLADYIVIPEALLTMNRGLAVPKDSELNSLLSKAITKAHESGIIDRLLADFNLTLQNNVMEKAGAHTRGKQPICLKDTLFLLFVTVCLLTFSTLIFLIELFAGSAPLLNLLKRRTALHMVRGERSREVAKLPSVP